LKKKQNSRYLQNKNSTIPRTVTKQYSVATASQRAMTSCGYGNVSHWPFVTDVVVTRAQWPEHPSEWHTSHSHCHDTSYCCRHSNK